MDFTNWFQVPHNLEQYSVLAIYPWNPKHQRKSKKNSKFDFKIAKVNFCLLQIPLTIHKLHILAS